jgi:hypothetical protein
VLIAALAMLGPALCFAQTSRFHAASDFPFFNARFLTAFFGCGGVGELDVAGTRDQWERHHAALRHVLNVILPQHLQLGVAI